MLAVIRAEAKARPRGLYFDAHVCVHLTGSVSHLKLVSRILTFALLCVHHWEKKKILFLLNFQPTERKHFCWRTAVLLQVQNKERLSLRCKFHTWQDKVACKRFANQSEQQEPLHLKSIYLLLRLAFVRFWQQKVQKDGKWISGRVQTLSYQPCSAFSWEVHVKSALRWHEQTGSAVNHDHPSPSFNGLIVWISLTWQEEGEALNISREIFNDTMRTFCRAGRDHGILNRLNVHERWRPELLITRLKDEGIRLKRKASNNF